MSPTAPTNAKCHEETHATAANSVLFDHFVGAREQRGRDSEAERLRGSKVDYQLELGGLLDGQIARLCPFENLVYEVRGAAIHVMKAHSVGHQSARCRKFQEANRSKAPLCRDGRD